ncbi:MAG: sigma-70 family RNA polymerase sigma factor [Verrucomicrobiales bacterium]
MLEGNRFEHLEREKGRFRSYLLGSLKHFLSHRFARSQAAKRGGNAESYSLNETGAGEVAGGSLPPDAWFDQQWALALLRLALLRRALARVELECRDEGNETQFQHLSPWLTGESEYGDQAELAEKVGVPVNTLKSTIHRLRRRSRKAVKAEISEMLLDSADVENEMTALFAALKNK